MNNSVFGKTMENIRNRVDVRLVGDIGKAKKLIAKPNLKHWTRFDENLIGVHLNRTKLVYNKPVFCGMSILDLSKTLIYDFHYRYILPKYEKKKKNFYLRIQIHYVMKLKQRIFSKILLEMLKKTLTRVIFQKIIQVESKEKTNKFLE